MVLEDEAAKEARTADKISMGLRNFGVVWDKKGDVGSLKEP